MNKLELEKLQIFREAFKIGTDTKLERDGMVQILADNQSITKEMYDSYHQGENVDQILRACNTIAGIILAGELLSQIDFQNLPSLNSLSNIDELMEQLHGKLKPRIVYPINEIKELFGIDAPDLSGTLTQMEWGMQYNREDLKP